MRDYLFIHEPKSNILESVIFMSRCPKCQNAKTLKTELKANGEIFSKTDTCANFSKNQILFNYPWFLQCMEII